ncbi:MAG: enoyl-CoA hydratase-related protein [Candidatus Neomarinimicrobiota bacterium]
MADVRIETTDGCALITVDRPEVLNALTQETIEALKRAFRDLRNDDTVGVVILTGEGVRAFIAGADIREIAPLGPAEALEFSRKGQDLTLLIEWFPKPVIAAVNGYALGGGCEIALACHIRIASENARFGQPEVNLGIIPGWGGTLRLPRVIGIGKAMEMITSGETISAQEVKECGLVNHLVPPGQLLGKAREIAQSILKRSPEAVKLSLEAIRQGLGKAPKDGMAQEASLFGISFSTPEKKEGTQAFIEKRKPDFRRRE